MYHGDYAFWTQLYAFLATSYIGYLFLHIDLGAFSAKISSRYFLFLKFFVSALFSFSWILKLSFFIRFQSSWRLRSFLLTYFFSFITIWMEYCVDIIIIPGSCGLIPSMSLLDSLHHSHLASFLSAPEAQNLRLSGGWLLPVYDLLCLSALWLSCHCCCDVPKVVIIPALEQSQFFMLLSFSLSACACQLVFLYWMQTYTYLGRGTLRGENAFIRLSHGHFFCGGVFSLLNNFHGRCQTTTTHLGRWSWAM